MTELQKIGIEQTSCGLHFQLPIGSITELMQFRFGIITAIEGITRYYDSECNQFSQEEEEEVINLLSRIYVAMSSYDMDLGCVLDDLLKIER